MRLEGGQHRHACVELSRLVLRVEALQGSAVAVFDGRKLLLLALCRKIVYNGPFILEFRRKL